MMACSDLSLDDTVDRFNRALIDVERKQISLN